MQIDVVIVGAGISGLRRAGVASATRASGFESNREALPRALAEDQPDRRAMIQACALCHGGVKE